MAPRKTPEVVMPKGPKTNQLLVVDKGGRRIYGGTESREAKEGLSSFLAHGTRVKVRA